MNFLRCFALGMIGGLIQGTVSQAKEPTTELQGNFVLSTASKTEATSARPTTVMRRIELRSSEYSVGPTKDVFEKREPSSRRMGYLSSAWKWDQWCMLQPVFGNCTEGKSKTKYYYSTQVDHCLPHVFRSCNQPNNFNQFDTFDDCINHCKGMLRVVKNELLTRAVWVLMPNTESIKGSALMPALSPIEGVHRCILQPISGRCLGSITMYYWDVNDRICKRFEYGGCSGNLNRFEAESHCLNHCKDDEPRFPDLPEWKPTEFFSSTTPPGYNILATTGDFVYVT